MEGSINLLTNVLGDILFAVSSAMFISVMSFAALTYGVMEMLIGKFELELSEIKSMDTKYKKPIAFIWINMIVNALVLLNIITLSLKGSLSWKATSDTVLVLLGSNLIFGLIISHYMNKIKGTTGFKFAIMHFPVVLERLIYVIPRMLGNGAAKLVNNMFWGARYLMIVHYPIMAVVSNFLLSVIIAKYMIGTSSAAGNINLIGSLIGGVAHAIIRANYLKEEKTAIIAEANQRKAKEHASVSGKWN